MLRDYCRVNEPGCREESSVSGPEVSRDWGGATLPGGTDRGGDWQVVRPQLPPSTRLPHLKGGPAWWRCTARWWGGGLRSQPPGPGPASQRPMMPLLPPPTPPHPSQGTVPHSPPHPQRVRCPPPPASLGSCRHRGKGLYGLGRGRRGQGQPGGRRALTGASWHWALFRAG